MSQAENNDKIKKYIPYGLGIVTILLVIVILTVGSQNLSKRQSVTVGTTASTTTHQCTKSDWIGHGFCDDETNNPNVITMEMIAAEMPFLLIIVVNVLVFVMRQIKT